MYSIPYRFHESTDTSYNPIDIQMFPMLLRTVKVLVIVIVIVMVGVIVDVIDMKVLTLLIIRLIFRCSRCCQASYCGASCQKSHWKTHKKQVALQNYLFYSRTRNITQTNEQLGLKKSLSLFSVSVLHCAKHRGEREGNGGLQSYQHGNLEF